MKKNILFITISTLTVILLLSMAALCNMCGLSLVSNSESTDTLNDKIPDKINDAKSNNDKTTSDNTQKKIETVDKTATSNNDSKNNSGSIKIIDLIVGDLVNGKVEPVDFLLADSSYTCYPLLDIPPDGTEKYNWSVSGGSCDKNTFLMQWNTPSDEGWYKITVDISNNNGGSGTKTCDAYINPSSAIGEPLMMPTIVDLRLYRASGEDDGICYVKTRYDVVPLVDGSTELIERFDFSFSTGNVISYADNKMLWEAPAVPQDVTITIDISDSSGIVMDSKQFVISVQASQ